MTVLYSISMKRFIDPVHLYDARGESLLTREHLLRRIAKLEKHNEILRNAYKALRRKQQLENPAENKPSIH